MWAEVAAGLGEVLICIGERAEEVIERGLIFREDDVIVPIGMRLEEEEAQHQIRSQVDKNDPAGEGEDVLEKSGGEKKHGEEISSVVQG